MGWKGCYLFSKICFVIKLYFCCSKALWFFSPKDLFCDEIICIFMIIKKRYYQNYICIFLTSVQNNLTSEFDFFRMKLIFFFDFVYYVKTKKNPVTKCYPQWVLNPLTSDSKSNTLLLELIWHVLLRRYLNFCSCTTWFLDLDDLVKINKSMTI